MGIARDPSAEPEEPEPELAREPEKRAARRSEAGPARAPQKELQENRKRRSQGHRERDSGRRIGNEDRKEIEDETHPALRQLAAEHGPRALVQRM